MMLRAAWHQAERDPHLQPEARHELSGAPSVDGTSADPGDACDQAGLQRRERHHVERDEGDRRDAAHSAARGAA